MIENQFTFLEQSFTLEKEEFVWQLKLKRSDINLANIEQLQLLEVDSPHFLIQDFKYDEEEVAFSYTLPQLGKSFSEIRNLPMSEQLRFCLNVLDLEEALKYPFGLILHPDNLFITKDLTIQMAYRSLLNAMVPTTFTSEDFLRQAKSLIISFLGNESFVTLYEGGMEVIKLPEYLNSVRQAQSLAELEEYLSKLYLEKKEQESQTQALVPSRRFKLYKYSTIWLSASLVILAVPLIYLVFFRSPFQAKMLKADKSFLKKDYSGMIDDMEKVPLDKIPYTQKYELAYAYVQGLDFNADQREVVMNNITLKSDVLYLNYWIQIGRGENGSAVDTAKRLDDVDLILYALAEQISATRKDNSLSGKDRDEKLRSLQQEYDQYWKDRKDALSGKDEDGTATTSTTSAPSSSSSNTSSSSGK